MYKRGLTLIEIAVVIGLVTLLTVLVSQSFAGFTKRQSLERNANKVKTLIEEARSLAISSVDDSQYGVKLGAGGATLFKGASFSTTTYNRTIAMDAYTYISSIALAGNSTDIVFKKFTGGTDQYGTTTLTLKANPTAQKFIVVHKTGLVELR